MKNFTSDTELYKKIAVNIMQNRSLDQSALIREAAEQFRYQDCSHQFWNSEEFSLLYGTPLWDQASQVQRLVLNHLYWVAYYSQVIATNIEAIYANHVVAAALYSMDNFTIICESLDFESQQLWVHMDAFRKITTTIEAELFDARLFSLPVHNLFEKNIIFAKTNWAKDKWRKSQLKAFRRLAINNVFLASQYLTLRGLTSVTSKLIQHRLSRYHMNNCQNESSIPSQISYHHFYDATFQFNTSSFVGLEIPNYLDPPTKLAKKFANRAIYGYQKDHYHLSVTVNGIFWYEPALFGTIYKLLRSEVFDLNHSVAIALMGQCFTQESEGLHLSFETHQKALHLNQTFVEPLDYLDSSNRYMQYIKQQSISKYLLCNRRILKRFGAKHENV